MSLNRDAKVMPITIRLSLLLTFASSSIRLEEDDDIIEVNSM